MACLWRASFVSYRTTSKQYMNLPQRQCFLSSLSFISLPSMQINQRQYSSTKKYFCYSSSSSSTYMSSSSSLPQQSTTRVTFLTDVEGDGQYFDRFIQHSKVMKFRSIIPSFGEEKYDDDGKSNNNIKWNNLGKWDEDYFPYDKEVVFIDHNDDDDDDYGMSMLVYGVSLFANNLIK